MNIQATKSQERTVSAPHMTAEERKLYEAEHREDYRGFTIVPKRDFGRTGYWSAEHRCNLNVGWVIVHGGGRYKGCNACPAATFAWTLADARATVDDLIAAGFTGHSDDVGGNGDSHEFWRLHYARHDAKRAADAAREAEVPA